MPQVKKARAIGLNHVALEVGDIDEALAFYGRFSNSSSAAGITHLRSSISATNS